MPVASLFASSHLTARGQARLLSEITVPTNGINCIRPLRQRARRVCEKHRAVIDL